MLHLTAAQLLVEAGKIEDAAAMFISSESWGSLIKVIATHAQAMITQGRHGALREWIERLPETERKTAPSVVYWHAHCLMPFQPDASRGLFEQAFILFKQQQDRTGMFLSLASASDVSILEGNFSYLDSQIALLNGMLRADSSFPSPEIKEQVTTSMFNALSMRQPWNASKNSWEEQALACQRKSKNKSLRINTGVYLTLYRFLMGNMVKAAKMKSLLREEVCSADVSPLLMITVKATEAYHDFIAADFDSSLKAVAEGLRLAEETGVHIWDNQIVGHGCGAALSNGDLGMAEGFLRKMKSIQPLARRLDVAYYHYLSSWHALLMHDLDRAFEQISIMQEMIPSLGSPFGEVVYYVIMAYVQHERDDQDQATMFLRLSSKLSRRTGSGLLRCMALIAEAHITFSRADSAGSEDTQRALSRHGKDCLRKALAIGREQGITNIFGWRPDVMAKLFSKALSDGIEVDYVRDLIKKRNLVPATQPVPIEAWPWPIKIYILGEFKLLRHNNQVQYSRKAPKKPLELLRVVIAMGGKNLSEERLMDILWPDAEGDSGRKTLSVTLVRLRELLGVKDALQVSEGMISLNDRIVWTDVWAFENLIEDAESRRRAMEGVRRNQQSEKDIALLEKAIGMYKGHFLAAEPAPWAVPLRERLRHKFIKSIDSLGRILESSKEYKKAIQAYQRGVETDDLAETYYQLMMRCCQRLGHRAEALAVYNRCKKTLAAYGIEPSEETEAIHTELLAR